MTRVGRDAIRFTNAKTKREAIVRVLEEFNRPTHGVTLTTPREDAGDYEIERTDTRLLLRHGGRTVGTLDWRLIDGTVHIDYVRVDPDLRGQGLGATLVAAAVQDARAGGRRVVPVCGYAAGVLRANPSWLPPGEP